MTTKQMLNYLADIDGFRGTTRDGGGIWYVSFYAESPFWEFLNRTARSTSMEKPLYGVGHYTFRQEMDIDKTLEWLVKEHKLYLKEKR